jgi:transcriptional regulator with XRE-family HTH domain
MLSIPKVSIRQLKAARALVGWSQEDTAAKSGVSVPTIKRLEASEGPIGGRANTGARIVAALEAAGVEFTNGDQPGVRLGRRKGESRMTKFQAGLCRMLDGNLAGPYAGATIETDSVAEAVEKAKRWARTVEDRDGAWLQILHDGKCVASFDPGQY